MSALPPEELIVKTSIELLSLLVNRTDEKEEKDCLNTFDDVLSMKLSSTTFQQKYEDLMKLIPLEEVSAWPISNLKSRTRWKYIRTNLQLMKIIHDVFVQAHDEKVKLISFSQKKIFEASFEFIFSLGVSQLLLPGVGIPLDCKSKHINKIPPENLNEFAKYRRLCQVLDDLNYLFDVDIFHDLIVAKHLEDLLAGLFQLSFVPLKKPCDSNSEQFINFDLINDDFNIKQMTFSMWKKFEDNKKTYKNNLIQLSKKIYKPLLIRKISLLLNSKNLPRWMKQNLTNFLSELLKENNGVISVIQAYMDSESHSPSKSTHSLSIAKLISHECSSNAVHIAPQLLELLKSERKNASILIFIQIAGSTIYHIYSSDPKCAEKFIFDEIFKPFKIIEFSTEDEICSAVHQLYNLFIIPTNDAFSVPVRVILPISRILFCMHCRIKDSVCYIKSNVKEILQKFLSNLDDSSFASVMNCFLFNAEAENIFKVPAKKNFFLSASGGVRIGEFENEQLHLEFAINLLDLIKTIPENEEVIRSLYTYLLKTFIAENKNEEFAEKRIIIMILLTELSQCPVTLKHILKDSENIIRFVGDLLANCDATEHVEMISISLTFLTMVLHDMKEKENVCWAFFESLLPPIEKLKHHSDLGVKFLTEEVCNLIKTRGLVGNVESRAEPKKPLIDDSVRSDCERYIEEACDPLLPIRAHALMELISLLKKSDPETLAKKDKIYCLFEENLKNQDSFLYLRAIEGLSCIATLKPDAVLPLLCQEFLSCSASVTQLKIGEVLVRTTKRLNDFIHPHKKLLICTLLNGVKSDDSLIRASCLSNLAELCLMLEQNVEDVLYEVLTCAMTIAQFDKDAEPRRAAILLVSGLFRGLKDFIFTVLESHLLDIYQTLKRLHSTDLDEVVRMQAAQALEILNKNTRQFISSKPTLEKEIHILRPL